MYCTSEQNSRKITGIDIWGDRVTQGVGRAYGYLHLRVQIDTVIWHRAACGATVAVVPAPARRGAAGLMIAWRSGHA